MTSEPEKNIADIISAAGDRLVSRIRLQKIAYLLDQLGADSGFKYSYHHYGPYSRDIDGAILDAEAFGLIKEEFGYRVSDGARYSIFSTIGADFDFTYLQDVKLRGLVAKLASVNVTILELAATAHWLSAVEETPDWQTEIVRRKGAKTDNGRLEEAAKLLMELNLPPATLSANG